MCTDPSQSLGPNPAAGSSLYAIVATTTYTVFEKTLGATVDAVGVGVGVSASASEVIAGALQDHGDLNFHRE